MSTPPAVEPHMRVYQNRVVLVASDGSEITFEQGPQSAAAKARYAKIRAELDKGWLDNTAAPALNPALAKTTLDPKWVDMLEAIADAVTNQVGRALVAISVLQSAIKAIEPTQSIRLTKGAPTAVNSFSWKEGLSMRSLSSDYLVPFLRRHGLMGLNADGPFMSRSYAENYPYSEFYKADLKGPRRQWNLLVEALEADAIDPKEAFVYLCALLANRSTDFQKASEETLRALLAYKARKPSFDEVLALIGGHVRDSTGGARLLEVAIHSFYQTLYWNKPGKPVELRELSQMRAANVKMGTVGDVELLRSGGGPTIVAWDAKLGISELTEQLGEIADKLRAHPTVERGGFVLDVRPTVDPLTVEKVAQAQRATGAVVRAVVFEDWAREELAISGGNLATVGIEWIVAYAETLCQKRREIAPLDEPSYPWVKGLKKALEDATP